MEKQIKLTLNGVIRRFPAPATFAAFLAKVGELFQIVATPLTFTYVDDENDSVVVSDEEEYAIALGCGVNPVKVMVSTGAASAPPADLPPAAAPPAAAGVATAKYAAEMAQLEDMGFAQHKPRSMRMLERHNGDVAQVAAQLASTHIDDHHGHRHHHHPHHGPWHAAPAPQPHPHHGPWHAAQAPQPHPHHGPWHAAPAQHSYHPGAGGFWSHPHAPRQHPWDVQPQAQQHGACGFRHHSPHPSPLPSPHHHHHHHHNKEWKNHPFMQLEGEAREAMKKQLQLLKDNNNVDGLADVLAGWGFDRDAAKALLVQHHLKVRKVVKILASSSPSSVDAPGGGSSAAC